MKYDEVFQMVGNTPSVLIRTPELASTRVYIKLEGYNPTGSIKDRSCVYMIRDMIETGRLRPSMTLLDASSGNMACALAYYGKLSGYSTSVVVSTKITSDKWNFIKYFGASITKLGDFTIQGNQFCRELIEREKDRYCFLDQLHNWANPKAHYETTGPEILRDFPDVAMVVGSLGSGGSLAGTAQFLKENKPDVRIVAVQSASGTKIPGTGSFDDGDYITPFIQKAMDEHLFEHTVKLNEEDAVRRTIMLRDQGIFCGLQTGGVLHAALASIRELEVKGNVVALSGDTGWKNMEKLISIANHE